MQRDLFIEGMSHAASTVNIVTTDGPAGRAGVTVSAMCSVTADAPTLLVCVHQKSAACEAILANGVLGQRFTRLSDDSAFTELALQEQSLETLINETVMKTLTRKPTAEELKLFTELLQPGYAERVNSSAEIVSRERLPRNLVGWSNHLSPRANEIKVELEAAVKKGDPPTQRLNDDWRNRYEDMLWSLLNSPEFIFVP